MDQQDTTTGSTDAEWPELSTDVSHEPATTRTIALDSQFASSEGGTLDVTGQVAEMRTRLSSVEEHLFDVATPDADDERFESIETSLEEADKTAREAYAYVDGLRLLQTEIVQALRTQLRSHEDRLDQFDGLVETVQASSAERVHMLEGQFMDALDTISQLTQLQRRNTTVETQLTDTLTAMSHGVESTQMSVSTLRSDLEAAQERIAQLEQRLLAAQDPPIPSVERAASSESVVVELCEPSVLELSENDFGSSIATTTAGDADIGWFTESYARRRRERNAI
jgi:chromosome segregation ATPase